MTLTKMVNGIEVELTAEEVAVLRKEAEAYQVEKAETQYIRDRLNEYPDWRDQLDQIYHEGLDAWKETIQAVKDKYPKP
tara:strand:+ start:19 stop:255 length:237 start_codon:yes stop_codon:yes gene_type:complete